MHVSLYYVSPHASILATWSEVGAEWADETNSPISTGGNVGGEWMGGGEDHLFA